MSVQVALILVGCLVSALLTFAVFYLREIKNGFSYGQNAQDDRLGKMEERINEMPEKYVFRDDFVRWTSSVDKKIDDLRSDIKCLIEREGMQCPQQTTGR